MIALVDAVRRWPGAEGWDHLPLHYKGLLVIAIPMAALIVVASVIFGLMANQRAAEAAVSRTIDIKSALSATLVAVLDAETSMRGFVLTGNRTWLRAYEDAPRQLRERLAIIESLVTDPGAAKRLTQMRALVDARLGTLAELVPYARPADPPQALLDKGHEIMSALRLELAAMNTNQDRLLALRQDRQNLARRRVQVMTGIAAALGIMVGLCALSLFAGGVAQRMAGVKENAERLAQGEPLLGHASTARDEVGHLDRALRDAATLLDDRVRELNLAREELDRFFALSPDMLCIADVNGRFQRLNPAWQLALGWTAEELTGAPYLDFVHDDDRDATLTQSAALAHGGVVVSFVNRYRTKDGSHRWLSWKAAGHVERGRIYAAARDVTEDKRVKEELQVRAAQLAEARLAAERANSAKTEFLSHMSHDLRTPLNAILGFAQLLKRDHLTPDQQEAVQHILAGGDHLLGLIGQVIDITRIESGQLSLSPEAVLLADVVQRSIELVQPLAVQRELTLDVEPLPPTAVLADRQRVQQILLNFLANAVKYNRPQGRIIVSVDARSPDRPRIAVHDTGPGMTAEKLARLFRPFERLGAEFTAVEGTGLGLALSRGLAEAMGGTVGVHSEVDVGSTFWVELPVATLPSGEERAAENSGPPSAVRHAAAGVVVYIEDNQANKRLMERILRHRPDIELLSETAGEAGIALVRSRRPDLVLLDLHLPDMTGEEVLWRLWQDPSTRQIPAVVLTADATPGLKQRLKVSGAKDHLTKPLNVDRVLEVVDRFLGARTEGRADVRPTHS